MDGYNFPLRSSSAYSNPRTDDWSKSSYASDHVCRPVIIDAEGRKRPIVSFSPLQNSDYIVTRTETVVQECVPSSFSSEHKHSSCRLPDQLEVYGVVEERWYSPSSAVQGRPPKVEEFITKVQTEASRPQFAPLSPTDWHQTTKSTGFPADTGGYGCQFNNTGGYGCEFNDYSDKESQKPSVNAFRNGNYGDYLSKKGSAMEPAIVTNGGWTKPSNTACGTTPNSTLSKPTSDISTATEYFKEPVKPSATTAPRSRYSEPALTQTINRNRETTPMEPTMITHGGWVRPSPTTWASPPDSNLSKPTSDINTTMGILKEAAKPAPKSQYAEPGFTETIDSKEAAKRYGKFSNSSRPYYTPEDNYTTTIDSREAARKYGGTRV